MDNAETLASMTQDKEKQKHNTTQKTKKKSNTDPTTKCGCGGVNSSARER